MPDIEGKRIRLRGYRNDDLAAIHRWANDAETVRYLSSRYWMPQSTADVADLIDHAMRAGSNGAFFVIASREDDSYLGQTDLYTINWKLRSAELAIVLGEEAQRGRGLGGEALGLLLAYAFGTLGLERVELEVATENTRAIRCYERAGFKPEGIKRHAFMIGGEYTDLAMMAVLAGEWKAAQGRPER